MFLATIDTPYRSEDHHTSREIRSRMEAQFFLNFRLKRTPQRYYFWVSRSLNYDLHGSEQSDSVLLMTVTVLKSE